jgi:hypothetical protein
MCVEIISRKCLFTQTIETLRVDSTGPRTYDASAFEVRNSTLCQSHVFVFSFSSSDHKLLHLPCQVTSDGIVADRKDYTLERVSAEVDFHGLNFGPADTRLVAAWLSLSRHGNSLKKLTFDSTGMSHVNDELTSDTITLDANDNDVDLSGRIIGAAEIDLLAAWISLPHVVCAISKLTVDVVGGTRSISTQVKPDTMGFLPDTTDLTFEGRQPTNKREKRHRLQLDASNRAADYRNLGTR